MEPSVYRISAVLAGQSAHVMVVGRDAAGRELQLELPPERARTLQVGQLLLLSWSAHVVPELDGPTPVSAAVESAAEEPAIAVGATTSEPPPATQGACACDEDEVFRMLGLA